MRRLDRAFDRLASRGRRSDPEDVIDRLERRLAGEPAVVRIPGRLGMGEPATRQSRRRRGLVTIGAPALAVLGAIALVVFLWPGRGGESAPYVDDGSTVPGTTTATTTTAALPGFEEFTGSVDNARLGTGGLVAISASEVWAVKGNLIGHLEDGEWKLWSAVGVVSEVAVAPDGTVWVASSSAVFSFDGAEWTRRFDQPAGSVAVDESGTVWIGGPLQQGELLNGSLWLARWDGESFVRVDPTPEAPPAPVESVSTSDTSMTVSPDGGIWIVERSWLWGDDLLMRYDGTTMVRVHVPGTFLQIEVAPNGDLLVGGFANDLDRQYRVARFDGDQWTEWPAHDWPYAGRFGASDMAVGPDGVLWFAFEGGLASVDGTEWTTWIEEPDVSALDYVSAVDVAPDGTVWYADADGVHIFTTP